MVIRRLYEQITGRPWRTVRSAAVEFGPPPGAVFRHELARMSEAELYVHGDRVVALLRARGRDGQGSGRVGRVA